MSKHLSALALAVAAIAAPATSFADVGLEGGSTAGYSYTGDGSFTAANTYAVDTTPYGVAYTNTVNPAVDNYFGVLTATGATTSTLNYTFASPTTSSGTLYVRLVTTDVGFDDSYPELDDAFSVTLFGDSATPYFSSSLKGSQVYASTGYYPDSGWFGFTVASGTTSFSITLSNGGDEYNDPTLFVDHYQSPPLTVPEPMSSGLALVGLAVAGLLARRKKAA